MDWFIDWNGILFFRRTNGQRQISSCDIDGDNNFYYATDH